MAEAIMPATLETSDRRFVLIGYFVVVVMFGGFFLWAALAPLDGGSIAPGSVVVESSRKTVQHLEGGMIAEVFVREGDAVEQGQPLALFDTTKIDANVSVLTIQYVNVLARLSRLRALRADATAIAWLEPEVKLSETHLTALQSARDDQNAVFRRQRDELAGRVMVLRERRAQVSERLIGLRLALPERQSMVESYERELDSVRALVESGFATEQRLNEVQRALADMRANLTNQTSQIESLESQILEIEGEMLAVQSQFDTRIEEQFAEARAQFSDVGERLRVGQDQLNRAVVRAPDNGIVLKIFNKTPGAVIRGGEPIMELVPTGERLRIDAKVPPKDIDRIKIGLEAEVRFSAFNSRTTPKIYGRVSNISADRIVDQMNPTGYYLAKIEVDDGELEKLGERILLPGMPASVVIKTGERTMLRYLAKPITDAMSSALLEE